MSFHQYRIDELYSDPTGTIQFIELTVGNFYEESYWAGVSLTTTRNGVTHTFVFPTDLPSTATANTTVLIATRSFADEALVTPNFIIPDGFLFPQGGSLNFGQVDIVNYPALPSDGLHSITRTGAPVDATPKNFGGELGHLSAPPPPQDLIVMGSDGDDTLIGNALGNLLTGGLGNDNINGGIGTDTAAYSTRYATYTLAPITGGYNITGPDGTDTLTSIERMQFLDANLAFDLDGNAGQVYRIYKAVFARTPDLSGLGGWIHGMDTGLGLEQVANSFIGSAEFQNLYGTDPPSPQFITGLYLNVMNRAPDADGLTYWVSQLDHGLQTRAQVLVSFSESGENRAAVQSLIKDGILFASVEQAAGPAQGQTFPGTASADKFIGSVGNDTFNGAGGNDSINGGAGIDISLYGGNRSTHVVTRNGSGLTVSGGVDGTDTLLNVERLKFADIGLAFDINGNAGQTYRLYQAAFDRTPDTAGLSDWIKGLDGGMSLQKVATGFIGSAEFQGLYGASPTDTQFVNLLYSNVLNRAPDQSGYDYWLGQITGGMTREMVLIGFSESAENQAALIGVIQDGINYFPG